ncbi:MAG: hypothetical protein KTR26_18910, partial [Flammeovirgaceae bacterium]|nr:hypothetical protein [Flammeovirgaceae bacterium]
MKYLSGVLFYFFISIQFTYTQSGSQLIFQDDSVAGNGKLILSGLEKEDFEALKELKPKVLQFQEFFPIYIGNSLPDKEESLLPVSGTYILENNTIRFMPRFPFLVNKKYYTCFYPNRFRTLIQHQEFETEEKLVDLVFLPQSNLDNLFPEVTNVYPSIAEIPQNQLRFYIHFSKKMLTGHSLQHINLYNQNGELEENAFLNLDPELWDPSGKRLTIWFDPGRIKRDLSPNLEYGVPLEIGRQYTLEVSSNFKDTQGNLLSNSFKKTFVVKTPDRSSPKSENWEISHPQPHSKSSLSIIFNE